MFNLFFLEDWNGGLHLMRASKIHKRVMSDCEKSDYNWVSSATKLLAVCNKKNFPEEYALDIKVAILNSYSVLIHDEDDYAVNEETDLASVYSAYNSLSGNEDEKAKKAREKFLNSFLSLIKWNTFLCLVHHGENFKIACREWQRSKFDELIAKDSIDFETMTATLIEDFSKTIKKLEENGAFDDEDGKEQQLIGYLDEEDSACSEKPNRQKMLSRFHPEQKQ